MNECLQDGESKGFNNKTRGVTSNVISRRRWKLRAARWNGRPERRLLRLQTAAAAADHGGGRAGAVGDVTDKRRGRVGVLLFI